jgi:L-asparaginase II
MVGDDPPKVLASKGNENQIFYPRSAMKYVQILPLIESGAVDYFKFTDSELAVMCSSHNSEPIHLATVRSILAKVGLNESDLCCGGHTPVHLESAFHYVREGCCTPFTEHIYNNCSGKHAGFLALSKYLGYSTKNYLLMTHPIQILIKEAVSDVFNIPINELQVGVDGCSAPAYAITVKCFIHMSF